MITFVAIGGFLGATARFFLAEITSEHVIGTWIVNIIGSCVLAISFRLYLSEYITETVWLFFGVGFSGAFTTFSTFGKEVIQFLLEGKLREACIYGCSSFFISFILVYIIVIL